MDLVHRDWDGKTPGRLPTLAYHSPVEKSAVLGIFADSHPDKDERGKVARLGIQAFDPQRHRIYWAWMNDKGTYQPPSHVRYTPGLVIESVRKAAAEAYDKAEREVVRQHNINMLLYLARRELLVAEHKLDPMEYGSPLVTEICVSWMLSLGKGFVTHIMARSDE